jgi:hypothetical protein
LRCNTAKLDEVELWHQWSGHLNFKDLFRAFKKELILGLPKMGKPEKPICRPCQVRIDSENSTFEEYCDDVGIKEEFSAPITPQKNGVVERNNRVIQDMARAMIHGKGLTTHVWGEVVNISYYVINREYLRSRKEKISYEIWNNKKPTAKHFHVFGSKCYILQDSENLGKFDIKSDTGIFLEYSIPSHAFRVYNKEGRL